MNQVEKDRLIHDMCMTYRHDFGLHKNPDDPSWVAGLTPIERKALIITMEQIFEHNIKPLLSKYNIDEDNNDISSETSN